MTEIGKLNSLKVNKFVDFGVYLDGAELGEILLPARYVPGNVQIGAELEVFIYRDSEDRLVGTTEKPYGMVGQFCYLKTVMTTKIGAFLDWGLSKDLLVPYREQKQKMEKGKSYLVFIYLDKKTGRIAASAKLDKFLTQDPSGFSGGQKIEALVAQKTDLGYKVIIDQSCAGFIHEGDIYRPLKTGQKLSAYIKKIRDDGKIDVTIQKPGFEKVFDITEKILDVLKNEGGFISVDDHSPPEIIYKLFDVSKKTYKKAIGILFKKKLIKIEKNGIRLL
jgi:predicted RNA-binding protein (virulence factor B family)